MTKGSHFIGKSGKQLYEWLIVSDPITDLGGEQFVWAQPVQRVTANMRPSKQKLALPGVKPWKLTDLPKLKEIEP